MEKRVFVLINANRKVNGVLRGYDVRIINALSKAIFSWPTHAQETWPGAIETIEDEEESTNAFAQSFMNLVLEDSFEEKDGGEKVAIGMIVCSVKISPNSWNPH